MGVGVVLALLNSAFNVLINICHDFNLLDFELKDSMAGAKFFIQKLFAKIFFFQYFCAARAQRRIMAVLTDFLAVNPAAFAFDAFSRTYFNG